MAAGYGYVATESTERTPDKQWDVDDSSMASNPDLARMARLRRHIVDTTTVDATTPTYGIGMSNGSAFCALWATASTKAHQPVAAVALFMAGVPRSAQGIGGLRVPTFMVVGQNDTRTNPVKERADLAEISAAGIPTELHEVKQRKVTAARYLRVPGVTPATATAIVAAYQSAGIIDDTGAITIALPKALGGNEGKAVALKVHLPSSLDAGQRQAVSNETLATIGEHQFNAEFKTQNVAFFTAHLTG